MCVDTKVVVGRTKIYNPPSKLSTQRHVFTFMERKRPADFVHDVSIGIGQTEIELPI